MTAFEEPETGGERWKARDFVGSVLIVDVQGPKEVEGPYGTSTVIVADVTVVPEKGGEVQKFPAAWISSKAMIDQMLRYVGAKGLVLVVEEYQNKKGQTGYRFAAPTPAQIAAAEAVYSAA